MKCNHAKVLGTAKLSPVRSANFMSDSITDFANRETIERHTSKAERNSKADLPDRDSDPLVQRDAVLLGETAGWLLFLIDKGSFNG